MGSIPTGVTFCYWTFWFSRSKASDVNTGIIAIWEFRKTSNGHGEHPAF